MVNFNIDFIVDDEKKQKKSDIGMIKINICYNNQNPYNVQLTSGFEKFIINIAIRIVLCNISKTIKPNLFIIDEGWTCLDSKNLSNIDTILNYIKKQFDHVIIISHLEELKNQATYVINIDKRKGFSHVNNQLKILNNKSEVIEI